MRQLHDTRKLSFRGISLKIDDVSGSCRLDYQADDEFSPTKLN
jgi:hypothetical protein